MADFIESFNLGLNLADEAEKNIEEIKRVFEQLHEQISNASEGRLSIEVSQKKMETEDPHTYATAAMLAIGYKTPKYRKYQALVIFNKSNQEFELAELEYGEKGYPFTFIINGNRLTCHEVEGIEKVLKQRLENPKVGIAIKELM